MTRPRLPVGASVAAAVFMLVLLCWLPGVGPLAHAAPGRAAASARMTAQTAVAAQTSAQSCDPKASLRPLGPPAVTRGSFMARIRARGSLIAGVDQTTYRFGYRNPRDGQIQGFDIDMLHAIAAAIFGNPDKIRYVAMSNLQRIPAIRSGKVDIVAHTMTIDCARWRQVDFSTVYFDAGVRVLVPSNSRVQGLFALSGQKVCTTAGSTALDTIPAMADLIPVVVPYATDCLVRLQQGDVAGISTDDSILAGLKAQDPYTKIVGRRLVDVPYGLAISQQHPDFVRFVNAVLARLRADGQWAASYRRWIGSPVPPPPPAQYRG